MSHIYLTYEFNVSEDGLIFGDTIERGYGDLGWFKPNKERNMFWYVFLKENTTKTLTSVGVVVRTNSIVLFKAYDNKLVIDINTQSGGSGVNLDNRTLHACTLVSDVTNYDKLHIACEDFLKKLMGDFKVITTDKKIYGFNNWYYAYGESNYQQILDDTNLLKEVTEGLENRPFMVIDDGWSLHNCSGSWHVHEKFKDMALLASKIKEANIRPGLWFRPLSDLDNTLPEYRFKLNKELFDPTYPEVLEHIKNDVAKFVSWGYELIKFDYVTKDLWQKYFFEMDENLTDQGWSFNDNHFTNAELTLKLYEAIREGAQDKAILIGCNTIAHLTAGICELNRIGDDTSGFDWDRTRKMGVNCLAYRLIQHGIFGEVDADCVGIMGERISWKQNREWLYLLAKSGTPLFVSCDPYKVTEEMKNDLKEAFKINSLQLNKCVPIDVDENLHPTKYDIDGEIVTFDWNK